MRIWVLAVLAASLAPAQVRVTVGRRKPITMKDMDQARDMSPLFRDAELAAKVHTVAVLTVAGPVKLPVGVKRTDATPLAARAETKLVAALTGAGYTVLPLDKTRETVAKEWMATYIDCMPDQDKEKLQNLSPEEREAYLKENAQKLCENPLTRALFGCPGQGPEAGGGDRLQQSSPNTLYLQSLTTVSMNTTVARIQRKEIQSADDLADDGAGQQLTPVGLRVAGELAEKLQADAVVVLTLRPEIEMNRAASKRWGKMAPGQGREFAIQNVRTQMVNRDGQFVFAEAIRVVNPEALSKKTFALNYEPEQVLARLGESLDLGVEKEVGHFAGKK